MQDDFRRWMAVAAIVWTALAVSGCETSAVQPQSTGASRQLEQATTLSRSGDHRGAAQAYETLAVQSPGELRDRYLLQAAEQYLLANDVESANGLLGRVSTTLPTADFTLRAQIAAELALRAQRPERALAELDRIPQPLPRNAVADVLALRARAQFAMNRPAAGVTTALERERSLSSQQDLQDNRRLIWEGLQKSAGGNADFSAPPGASPLVVGWLELGRAALTSARNPFAANDDLADWRTRYPSHPANSFITEHVLPQLGIGLEYPTQVALVLPLSGRQQAAGIAVRDGFMAAVLQQETSRRPVVNVYDSGEMGATTAYRRAIADGAQFVVGPLMKDEVATLASSGDASVLTLALNQLPDGVVPPALMFQFALDPEEEARQVAQRLVSEGRLRGLVLLPNSDWGQRVFRAFDTELKTLGGAILSLRFYDTAARDYSELVAQLLLIDESRARANALMAALGTRLEFEPRHRTDAQFVFMGAQPTQGRSLRPALLFHLAGDPLPIYATSDIFEPDGAANDDLEGVVFPHMPLVISPDAVSRELRSTLNKYWPSRARGRGGLYAFGFDAYRIIPILKAGRFGSGNAVPGMTGLLSIDAKGRVRRELEWARVTDGKAAPLGTSAATAAR